MIRNLYQGDPKIFITENGADLVFRGGQPVMDAGLENAVIISLHTKLGWFGNVLMKKKSEKIGSRYEEETKKPITINSINAIRESAEEALSWMTDNSIASAIGVNISNPTGDRIDTEILIQPPGDGSPSNVLESKNGINWTIQAIDPAYRKE